MQYPPSLKTLKVDVRNPNQKPPGKLKKMLFGGMARQMSWQVVERSVGYWLLWSQIPGGRKEIVAQGWLNRATSFERERDFKIVFGVPVEEFDPSMLVPFFYGESDEQAV